jgi:hypothetical protein
MHLLARLMDKTVSLAPNLDDDERVRATFRVGGAGL